VQECKEDIKCYAVSVNLENSDKKPYWNRTDDNVYESRICEFLHSPDTPVLFGSKTNSTFKTNQT